MPIKRMKGPDKTTRSPRCDVKLCRMIQVNTCVLIVREDANNVNGRRGMMVSVTEVVVEPGKKIRSSVRRQRTASPVIDVLRRESSKGIKKVAGEAVPEVEAEKHHERRHPVES